MDAITAINEKLDFHELLKHYDFDGINVQGTMIRACCKLHGGNNPTSFVVNTDNNLFYCHTGNCGGGDAITLIQKLEECTFFEAIHKLANIFHVDLEGLEIEERKPSYVEETKNWMKVMENRKKVKKNDVYQLPTHTRNITKFRDFDLTTIQHFGLQYIDEITCINRSGNPYTMKNRLLFPIVQQGIIIGMSLRRIKAKDIPKWSHQPTHMETKNLLYNYDAVQNEPVIVITEGIVDVWAYHEIGIPAVATFGAHVTNEQYHMLMRTGADLVFSFDGDEAGRDATKKALNQFRYKANMYVVPFESDQDPASIPREELQKRYVKRQRVI